MKISQDIHNNVKIVAAVKPVAVGTTGSAGGQLSSAIDRKGYGSVEFIYQSGGSASVADRVTPVVLEGDTTNGSFTSAAAGDLVGSETALTLTTAAGKIGKVGYKGNKRYVKLRLYGLGTATALVAGSAVLSTPEAAPVA